MGGLHLQAVGAAVGVHRALEAELAVGSLDHLRFVRVLGDEAEDLDSLGLPDAVRARHRLHVVLRVPVGVEDDARVGGDQVDAEAARARREQEGERLAARLAEAVDGGLAQVAAHGAV